MKLKLSILAFQVVMLGSAAVTIVVGTGAFFLPQPEVRIHKSNPVEAAPNTYRTSQKDMFDRLPKQTN